MKKYLFIIIDSVIVLALCIGVFVYLKYYSPKPSSIQTTSCTPAESNDCKLINFEVINGPFKKTWKNISILLDNIPTNSWYKIIQNTDENYEIKLYPHVGKHYILGSHDFMISLKITKTNRPSTPLSCTTVNKLDPNTMFPSGTVQNGPYDIAIYYDVNYYYDGGPGSNPNPYTDEVNTVLNKILDSIQIGSCKYQ